MEQEGSAVKPLDSGDSIATKSEVSRKSTEMQAMVDEWSGDGAGVQSFVAVLPRLSSAAQHKTIEVEKDYKSGAVYKGEMADNKRYGRGLFVWTDGTRYEGEFTNNSRNGNGSSISS